MVSADTVRAWLAEVPDPEIPAVSVVDLGIVRDVAWDGDTLTVGIVPTYSGCPAGSVIALDIQTALHARGIEKVRVNRLMSPVWTTDWIGPEAKAKLAAYGIAPPGDTVACPRCGAETVEVVSQFGSTPCKAQYRCLECLEPFDRFKCL